MGEEEAKRWREFYWAALLEVDSTQKSERIDIAHAAIKNRLQVLPHGLDDIKEMKEINFALRRLAKLRRKVSRRQKAALARTLAHEFSPENALLVIDLSNWRTALTLLSGALLGTSLSVLVSFLIKSNNALDLLPFAGLASVVLIGMRLGALAGVMGSLLVAVVFAYAVPPAGHFAVKDAVLRESIAWMALGGIALSYLLLPFRAHKGRDARAA
jgi:hypothetical protein